MRDGFDGFMSDGYDGIGPVRPRNGIDHVMKLPHMTH